jgi:hypothetical protein
MSRRPGLLVGLDLGKVTGSVVVWDRDADPGFKRPLKLNRRHHGRPAEFFREQYGRLDPGAIAGIAACGVCADFLAAPVQAGRDQRLDGVVVIAPWGCAPGHIAEAQLRRASRLPTLFLVTDGSPLDPRKLKAFAWRLQHGI